MIVTSSTPAVIAAKKATSTIPIVFTNASDPVANGLIMNLSRRGINATGLSTQLADTTGKRLGFLRDAVGRPNRVTVVFSSADPAAVREKDEVHLVTKDLGAIPIDLDIERTDDLSSKSAMLQNRAEAFYICNTNFFNTVRP